MPKTLCEVATLILLTVPAVFAQQLPPSVITDPIMDIDAATYQGIGNTTPNVDVVIAQRSHFDPGKNTYILADHSNEPHRARTIKRDELLDLRELTYNCEAVILGTPTFRRSALTADRRFVFSDYEVRIDAIFSDRKKVLEGANRLIVSRAGGNTVVDGNKVTAIETEFPLFHLGEQYLFFLIRNPSGTFSVGPNTTYLVSGQSLKAARIHPKNETVPYPLALIEKEIREAAYLNPRGDR